MAIDLAGRRVLVTGASLGIGRETALAFAAAHCRVVLTYREHRTEAEEAARRCLGLGAAQAEAVQLDQSDERSVVALADFVRDRFGGLDVLVNNAGVISWQPFREQTPTDLDEQVGVNLLGVMKVTWHLLPLLTDAVVVVGSTASLHSSHTPPPYVATKWGVRGFVKALAVEYPGLRIVAVHPTVTATRMNDMRGMAPERVARVIVRVAAGEIDVESGGDVDLRDHGDASAD
ncbi:MAG: SDR family oxidoreductase [Actinobacteria bacterium]|nr:SDR family oxidoreductase [Actinomycetota bacterium]